MHFTSPWNVFNNSIPSPPKKKTSSGISKTLIALHQNNIPFHTTNFLSVGNKEFQSLQNKTANGVRNK